MKRTESLYRTAVLLLLLMLAAACTRDDIFDGPAPGNGATPLAITVTDGAYTSAPSTSAASTAPDGTPVTRAVERGFATEFTKDDRIGLYVTEVTLNNSGSPDRFNQMLHENLCLTYDGTTWTLPAGTELKYNPSEGNDILYFAYYPYQADMTGKKPDGNNTSGSIATEAPEFFHALIDKWKPNDDQSTYAAYAASDLMVAQGVVSTRTDGIVGAMLNFTMQHQMLLNIVRLPHTTSNYKETIGSKEFDKSYNLYTGVAQLPNFWMENPHTARLITKPGVAKKIVDCSYYDSNSTKHDFDITILQDALRGKYKTYTVDGATETKSDRGAPREGDFYMKDGTVLPQEAYNNGANIPDDVKADCIGIVFWVGEKNEKHWTQTGYRQNDLLLTHDHPTCTHGMVVALQNASESPVTWATNPLEKNLWEWAEAFNGFTDNEKSLWKMIYGSNPNYGYAYNAIFGLYTAHNKGNDFTAYEAVKTYAGIYSTPEGCSGWFFPCMFELATIWFNAPDNFSEKPIIFDRINPQIKKVGGTELEGSYWSSYDYGYKMAWAALSNSYGARSQTEKHNVRAVLAF